MCQQTHALTQTLGHMTGRLPASPVMHVLSLMSVPVTRTRTHAHSHRPSVQAFSHPVTDVPLYDTACLRKCVGLLSS